MEIKELKELAKDHVSTILQTYAPAGRWNGPEYEFLNPTRSDSSLGSCKFSTNPSSEYYMTFTDFADNDFIACDIIDFIKIHIGSDNAGAIKALSNF